MRKNLFVIAGAVVVLSCCGTVFSQQRPADQASAADIFIRLNEIEKKIDKLAEGAAGGSAKQLLSRLDQVLENQRQMAKELEVIKVRASRN